MNRRILNRLLGRRHDAERRSGETATRPADDAHHGTLRGISCEVDAVTTARGSSSAEEIARLRRRLIQAQVDTIVTIVAAVEAKDPYTKRHSAHVPRYAEHLARALNLSARETEVVKIAALLHDSGKIGVPDSILTKAGPLTAEEFTLIRKHPNAGAAILNSATCLRRELPLVLYHHERYDGAGYPDGLKGKRIPLGARILNVADSMDAMICPRSYKRGLGLDEVASELRRCCGTQFDPDVVRVALHWLNTRPEEITADSGMSLGFNS